MENVSKSAIATKSGGGKNDRKVAGSSNALTEVKTEGGVPEEESKEDDDDQIVDETPEEMIQEIDDIEDMHGDYGDEDNYSETYEEEEHAN